MSPLADRTHPEARPGPVLCVLGTGRWRQTGQRDAVGLEIWLGFCFAKLRLSSREKKGGKKTGEPGMKQRMTQRTPALK